MEHQEKDSRTSTDSCEGPAQRKQAKDNRFPSFAHTIQTFKERSPTCPLTRQKNLFD